MFLSNALKHSCHICIFSYGIWSFHMLCRQKDESFYTVSWACNIDGTPLLVAGGLNGVIRVIDAGSEKIYKVCHACGSACFSYFI